MVLLVVFGRFRWSKAQALVGKFSMVLVFQGFNNHEFGLQWQIIQFISEAWVFYPARCQKIHP